jgi:monovalent cation:H+ antiporter-2, CPA2 family
MPPVVQDLLIILACGFIAGVICKRIGVSLIIGYLLVGMLLTILANNKLIQRDSHGVEDIARMGVLMLLFAIGLEFSLDELTRLGRFLVVGGGIQMLFTAAPAATALHASGAPLRAAILLGVALALSSTVLVYKALNESGQVATAHGRRAMGILLFQDIAVVPMLLVIPLLTGEKTGATDGVDAALVGQYLQLGAKSGFFIMAVLAVRYVLRRWMAPWLSRMRQFEIVLFFALAMLGGSILTAASLGLPMEIGAFAAGLIFSGNRLTAQVDALLLPFREAFSAVFFVSLGGLMDPAIFWTDARFLGPALAGIILLKTAAAAMALRMTGMGWKASLGMGMGLGQLSEFSFILALAGSQNHVLEDLDYHRILALALATFLITPQLLKVGLRLVKSAPAPSSEDERRPGPPLPPGVRTAVVIGAGPIGSHVASRLEIFGFDVCVVDLSRTNLFPFAQMGFRTVSGDAVEPIVLAEAGASKARVMVICLPDDDAAMDCVRAARRVNGKCVLVVRCRYTANRPELRRAGADLVISEESLAMDAMVQYLHGITDPETGKPLA